MLRKTYSACHAIQLTVTCNSTEAQKERTAAFPLQNGYVNAPCRAAMLRYTYSTMPLLLISITANKNHTLIYGSIHLLKYYSYSANSCTFLTRASIGVISNSQHMFCSMWHAKNELHSWTCVKIPTCTVTQHTESYTIPNWNMFTRFYQSSPIVLPIAYLFYKWYQLLRLCIVQWRSKVIWRPGLANTTVAPTRHYELYRKSQ